MTATLTPTFDAHDAELLAWVERHFDRATALLRQTLKRQAAAPEAERAGYANEITLRRRAIAARLRDSSTVEPWEIILTVDACERAIRAQLAN